MSQDSVATAAYQGVAAQAANGRTIHKLFGWNVNSRKRWTPTNEQKERFAKLRLLIIDEVSTCDVSIIGKVEVSLRLLLDNPSKLFGGIHVLLVGDWLQQLPVAGQPAFIAASEILHAHNGRDAGSADYLDRVRGINAYRSLNFVVILAENVRHRNDEVWKRILDKWRVGRYDDADIAYVNKIAYNENWTSDRADKTSYCPIIVTSNAIRVEFNSSALQAFCRESGAVFHCFPAQVTRPHHHLSNIQRKLLTCIREDKTSGMPISLEIAVGSMVQCTKNVSNHFKLANGCIGTVVAITPAQNDDIRVRVVDGVEEHQHSLPPEVVFIRLKDYSDRSFHPEFPFGVVPVCQRYERGISVKLPDRQFSVCIRQVPLVLAYSLTTEKCQGLTLTEWFLLRFDIQHDAHHNDHHFMLR
ncbi:unnamed protein product [Phytophthora fragariaefolia]|uniref:ATP-dependent DNA helicase n=1 Tax=Phytophthora fragariaefolia TaxID=1490495 RepID=A0A9W6X5N4_9STRA|nr:unnamed protein product [Phytophthora fragariaefolia]